jgi:hypothetical protein
MFRPFPRDARRALLVGASGLAAGCALFYPLREKGESDAGIDGPIADVAGADVIGRPFDTPECPVVYPRAWSDPHAVVLGAYAQLPALDPENSDLVWSYELAVREFDDKGGLPDAKGALHTLVLVVCNGDPAIIAKDPAYLLRSLDHLVDDLGVSAVVADLSPKDLIFSFRRTVEKGKDVFFLGPGPANNELARLDDQGRVWSMLGLPADLAPAYKALLQRVESYIRSIDPSVQKLRVAVARSSDVDEPRHEELSELADAITRTSASDPNPNLLVFNGTDVASNEAAGNYREYTVDADPGSPASVGQQLLDYQPHVIISMMGPAFTHFDTVAAFDGVEDTIESRSTDHGYPFYVLSPVNASAWQDVAMTIKSVAQRYPDAHRRFLGIDVATADDPTLYYQYLDRLRSPTAHPEAREGTENYYDPIYYLAYAMYRAGVDRPILGGNILAGMNATLAGARYDVGPDPIPFVFLALQPTHPPLSIELVGTMGEPNFNQLTGTRVNRAALYCFPPPPTFDVARQVQVYAGGTWQGTFGCFAGF